MVRSLFYSGLVIGACLLVGCARKPNSRPAVDTGAASATATVAALKPAPPADTSDPRSQRAVKSPEKRKSKNVDAPAFVGPFPHRVNPFEMPNADKAATAAKTRVSEKRVEQRLLGFVNVDGRKALIQIDGKVWAAREGESRDGIEVVKISPARVTLRRDGATWDVSLLTRDRSS